MYGYDMFAALIQTYLSILSILDFFVLKTTGLVLGTISLIMTIVGTLALYAAALTIPPTAPHAAPEVINSSIATKKGALLIGLASGVFSLIMAFLGIIVSTASGNYPIAILNIVASLCSTAVIMLAIAEGNRIDSIYGW